MSKGNSQSRVTYSSSIKLSSFMIFCSLPAFFLLLTGLFNIPYVQGHLDHLPHFNSGGNRYGYGDYISYIALEPEYGTTEHPSQITFSVQDFDGNDIYNISTMVEIYDSINGNRTHVFPWTFRDVGDFHLYYQFPKKGTYQIVLGIRDDIKTSENNTYGQTNLGSYIEPPRSILGDISNCDCTRTIFNISIATTFGTIQNSLFFICIISPITLLGIILTMNYYKRKRRRDRRINNVSSNTSEFSSENHNNNINMTNESLMSRKQVIRYSIMLLALAGGIVHLVVFPEHGSLHVYYSIFLLAAAGGQVAYGVLYFLIMLSKPFYEIPVKNSRDIKSTYLNNMALNWFGFIGTAVLVGLYVYVLFYPPPLSPTNQPEDVELAGILAKSLEVALLIGIAFLIRWDRQELRRLMIKIKTVG